MRWYLSALILLCLSSCSRPTGNATDANKSSEVGQDEGLRSTDGAPSKSTKIVPPENAPDVAEAFGILLESNLPGLTEDSDDEVEARKRRRRPPPAPLEWKILPANVLSNYYLLEPSTGPITWRGIVIGYRKRDMLLDGTIIETWYEDAALTAPLQGVRIVTTSATDKNGTRQFKVSISNDAWEANYVVSAPKGGPIEALGSSTADGKTTTVTVKQNASGAAKPFHVHYTDSSGQSADADVSPKVRKPSPQPPAPPNPVPPAPAPGPSSDADNAARAAKEAERVRKALESAERTREQIEQLRKTQEAIRQVEAARKAVEQVEAARRAAEQAEAARKAVEQVEAARRAAEQAEAARRAAEAARQPRVPIIPH